MILSFAQRFVFAVLSIVAAASISSGVQADELGQTVRTAVQSADATATTATRHSHDRVVCSTCNALLPDRRHAVTNVPG